jgi:tetratricopeptide (TPR) repeat protein
MQTHLRHPSAPRVRHQLYRKRATEHNVAVRNARNRPEKMPDTEPLLFVSHVSEDRVAALEIAEELERRGVQCWIAPRDVQPGSRFDDEIADALDSCRAMLLIFSERCNDSAYIRREVTVAGENHKVIIPFRIEDAQPRRGLRVRLSDLHWIDAFASRERAIDELAKNFAPLEKERLTRPKEKPRRGTEEDSRQEGAGAARGLPTGPLLSPVNTPQGAPNRPELDPLELPDSKVPRSDEAIAVYDDVLARFNSATELPLREQVARALRSKAATLSALGRPEEEIAVYDDLLARFGSATELPLREQVAIALRYKSITLSTLGRSDEAIALCDEVLARFGSATEPPLREQVAKALFYKGATLGTLGRSDEAIAVYDDVLARFGSATELPLREQVAQALCCKGVRLSTLGRLEEEIAVYDDLLARFGSATELPLREQVAMALRYKSITLGMLGRPEEAIAVYDDVLARFGSATELPLREQVAKAKSSIEHLRSS